MKIIINQKFENYKNDNIKHYVFQMIYDWFFWIFIAVYIIALILKFLVSKGYLNISLDIINPLAFAMPFGIGGMLLYSVFHLILKIRQENRLKNVLYEGEMEIKLTDDGVSVQTSSYGDLYSLKWNEVKELVVIKKTIFLIPVYKDGLMIRINKKELIQGDFEEAIHYIKSKFGK